MRVGIVAHGPGTANVLGNIKEILDKMEVEVFCYPFTKYASDVLGSACLDESEVWDICNKGIDVIFTGTGSLNEVERVIPVLAKSKGIEVVSVLDTLDGENAGDRYFNKPDHVIVGNVGSKLDILKRTGLQENQIHKLGNPYLELFIREGKEVRDKRVLVYASEPGGRKEVNDTSLRSKEVIMGLAEDVEEGIFKELWIGIHPREDRRWVEEFIKDREGLYVIEGETIEKVQEGGVCVHLGSTVGIESSLMGIPSFRFEMVKELRYKIKEDMVDRYELETGFEEKFKDWFRDMYGSKIRKG